MEAKEYLEKQGVFSLDTKKRYNEVIEWMEGYSNINKIPSREWLIKVIDTVVDETQTLGADDIADGIIENLNKLKRYDSKR